MILMKYGVDGSQDVVDIEELVFELLLEFKLIIFNDDDLLNDIFDIF